MKRARRSKPDASQHDGHNTRSQQGKSDSQSVRSALNSFTEEELNLLATTCFILVLVCVIGVVSIHFQCRRLQRTLHERRRTKNKMGQQQKHQRQQHRQSSRRPVVSANGGGHYSDCYYDDDLSREQQRNQDAKQMLQAEVEAMRHIQDQVREQATMVRQLYALRFRDPTRLSSSTSTAAAAATSSAAVSALPSEEEPSQPLRTSTAVRQRRSAGRADS